VDETLNNLHSLMSIDLALSSSVERGRYWVGSMKRILVLSKNSLVEYQANTLRVAGLSEDSKELYKSWSENSINALLKSVMDMINGISEVLDRASLDL